MTAPATAPRRVFCAACRDTANLSDCLTYFPDDRPSPTAWPEMTTNGRRFHYCPRPECRAWLAEVERLGDRAGVARDGEQLELELGALVRLRLTWENRSRRPMLATPDLVGRRRDGSTYRRPRGGLVEVDR